MSGTDASGVSESLGRVEVTGVVGKVLGGKALDVAGLPWLTGNSTLGLADLRGWFLFLRTWTGECVPFTGV